MKINKRQLNLSEYDDDALEIMYQWAQCAIVCRTAQVHDMSAAIISAYQDRQAIKSLQADKILSKTAQNEEF